MKKLLLGVALMCASIAGLAEEFSTADTNREVVFQALNIVDWAQTRYMSHHPDQYYEMESAQFMGSSHPTSGKVDAYMAESAVLHLIVSKLLPAGAWREAFQYITIGGKLNATIGNASIGIKMDF